MDTSHTLVWFRNDLRVADNPALEQACRSSEKVSAVYVVSPTQWQSHHLSDRRIRFTLQALESLQQSLAGLGIPLHILSIPRFADVAKGLISLCRKEEIGQICFNREYALDEVRRDAAVEEGCEDEGIAVFKAEGTVIIPPGAVLNKQGETYKVFTPFKRAWLQTLPSFDRRLYAPPEAKAGKIKAKGFAGIPQLGRKVDISAYPATEDEAHRRLRAFVEDAIDDYQRDRDLPSIDGTSQLSPYLTIGLISPRACLHAARAANQGEVGSGSEGVSTWVGELIWREFYLHILAAFPRLSRREAFKPETEAVPWNNNDEDFRRWCEGETGFPLVDAAMRQMNATGWMHNRLRMVTATFLSKHLLIDWRRGEDYFMEQLVDGHFASNNGGWQWSSSTGTDAAPYFRILSPVRQAERFDPQGEFIKTWIPELAAVPAKVLHKPGHQELLATGYPAPMVDLKEAKERCLSAFRYALDG